MWEESSGDKQAIAELCDCDCDKGRNLSYFVDHGCVGGGGGQLWLTLVASLYLTQSDLTLR